MTVRLIFAWFDFWVGLFWDRKQRVLYFFPVPMFGLMIRLRPKPRPDLRILRKGRLDWLAEQAKKKNRSR